MSITDVLAGRRSWHVETGDALDVLRGMPDRCVQACVTSPPYWGLRDYGVGGQLGLEPTPEEYVTRLVEIFREVRRVLRDDGTLWLNLGDSYAGSMKGIGANGKAYAGGKQATNAGSVGVHHLPRAEQIGLKPKDLVGIPWRVAFALQQDGWWLRSDIVWCLSGGTKVYAKTQKGVMPMTIKDMVRLDPSTVQLWNGEKWTQVLGWSESPRPDNPIEIVLRSGEKVGCTPNHLWPTQRGLVRADELRVGDVIGSTTIPEPETPIMPYGLGDIDVGWLVGMYIAEGSKSQGTIQIASHVSEHERFERLAHVARGYHGTCAKHGTGGKAATINLNGKIIEGIIDTYVSGRTAKTKHLTTAAWQRSNEFLLAVLHGYLEGDGHHEPQNNRWRLGFTRNYAWAEDLRTIAARLGIQLRLNLSTANIGDKTYPTFRGELRFTTSDHFNAKADTEIVAIGRSRARKFWDIGVADEPHLFALASGVLTHNSKPNPMPESVTDRPTKAHEYIFLLSKSSRYYYDADAIREPMAHPERTYNTNPEDHKTWELRAQGNRNTAGLHDGRSVYGDPVKGRNKRTVWTVATKPFPEAHFAVYPPDLIEPCVLAGASPKVCPKCGAPWERVVDIERVPTRPEPGENSKYGEAEDDIRGGFWTLRRRAERRAETVGWQPTCDCDDNDGSGKSIVLDPFSGAGTTGLVATRKSRAYIGIELNEEYANMARRRIEDDAPLFNRVWEVSS